MGNKSGSGFYLSKSTVAFFTLLFAALFIAFTVFAVLYLRSRTGFCNFAEEEESDKVKPLNCTVVPTPGRQGIWDHYRLPTSLVPINYQLVLWPRFHPESPESTFTGDVNITFQCKNATDVILLHSEQIEVTVVELVRFEIGTEAPQILEVWRSSLYSYLVINLNETLTENSIYVLRISFSGVIGNSTGGFMKMDYEEDGRNLSVITTQMEPTYARTVFPCFDEPSFKATFDIHLIYLPNYVALSNMPAINTSPISDGDGVIWKVTTFNTTLKMSTYIVACVICEFSHIEMIEHGNEIRIWARKSAIENGEADYALNITGAILRHVMDYLNVSYPLTKTELVAVPEFPASGMENWGLIIFHEDSLLFNYSSDTKEKRRLICSVITHEIGHQWFGNLVTMNWWNQLWLKEGLSSYIENTFPPKLETEMFMKYNDIPDTVRLFHSDTYPFSHPLVVEEENLKTTNEINEAFDSVTYHKGSLLMQMVITFLSQKLFQKGLTSYLQDFSYTNVKQDDLWHHWQKAIDSQNEVKLPASVKTIMDKWTMQTGYPIITLNTSTGTLSQEPFDAKRRHATLANNTWYVPIEWIKNGSAQPLTWLKSKEGTFPEMKITSENDWILLNANITGYYRVQYDALNWNRIINQLIKDPEIIPLFNRVFLLGEVFHVHSENVDVEIILNATKYLAKEKDLFVWQMVLVIVENYMAKLQPFLLYGSLKQHVSNMFLPFYQHIMNSIGGDIMKVEKDSFLQDQMQRVMSVACWLGFHECLQMASKIFREWIKNPTKEGLPLFIREVILSYGIESGSFQEWEIIWNIFLKQKDNKSDYSDELLFALSFSKEPWILNRYLQLSLNSSIFESHSVRQILMWVAENKIGTPLVWDFVQENWEIIKSKYNQSETELAVLMGILAERATSDYKINEMLKFVNTTMKIDSYSLVVLRINDVKEMRSDFNTKFQAKIQNWLKNNLHIPMFQ
ncbi:aminopeptidase Q-like isoform X2 [Erpetoichthys calabaricus]|uniref:aminopeptidase Q-like isoform X2 n=1 Tax=Erpetoichthys calabaricus TaxID=27687 RepID=UPI002234CF13|nr:aminopeptidase Q-like isoform X2 [Erpetoichthys calabaricus]